MTGAKVLAGVVLILIGLGIAAPYVLGMFTHGVVSEFVDMSNVTGDAAVEIVEYERGWFDSRMRLAVRFPEDEDTRIVFDHRLHHGPLLPASPCGGRFGFALSRGHSSLRPITPVVEHFLSDGRISEDCFFFHLNGDIRGTQRVVGFEGTDFDPNATTQRTATLVAWAPISVEWTYLSETRPKLRGTLRAPHFTVNDNTTHVQIDALGVSMDLQRAVLPELWDGTVTISMDELRTWEAAAPAPVSIEQLEMLMLAETGTEEADFGLSLRYAMLRIPDQPFGKGGWSLEFENLGTRGIQAFNERRESLLAAGIPQESELYVEAFRQFMPEILATEPRVVVDFAQDLDDAPISAKGYARITDPDVVMSDDPRQWLTALELDLALSAPEAFVRDAIEQYQRRALENSAQGEALDQTTVEQLLEAQSMAMLMQLEQSGFLEKRDGAYRSRLYLRDGNVTVNKQHLGSYVDMLLQD